MVGRFSGTLIGVRFKTKHNKSFVHSRSLQNKKLGGGAPTPPDSCEAGN